MSDPRRTDSPSPGELAGLGILLAVSVLLPLIGGLVVDSRLGTAPFGVIVGMLLGIVAAVGVVYVRFKRYW